MTATNASPGPSSGSGTSSTCSDLRGSLSLVATPSNMSCSSLRTTAARIDPDNLRRSVRALEVLELTGRPFSRWRWAWDAYEACYPLIVVGVAVDRARLAERIAARVDAMLAGGLVDECRRLAAHPLSTTARQAIGYAEVFDHLAGRCSLGEARERIVARTRRYAARQQRWFRADPRVAWETPDKALEALLRAGEAPDPPDEEAATR